MKKLNIPYPVIVEGKYDRLKLQTIMEGQIIQTDGFGIFKKAEKAALLRALSAKTPLIVLTDPDGAGALIRAHLSGLIPKERLLPLYVPQIKGKEKRKSAPSAAGFLGVEGQEREALYRLLAPFATKEPPERAGLTKADLYAAGLTGIPGCTARREALARRLALPADMTPNAFLAALNILLTKKEFWEAVRTLDA